MKWLFIEFSKTSLKPSVFSSYNIEKLIQFFSQDSLKKGTIFFIYKYDDRIGQYLKQGYIENGSYRSCSSDMFNFSRYIHA